MELLFENQFIEKIFDDEKIHTIRKDKRDRWKLGNCIEFCNTDGDNFTTGICTATQTISIRYKENGIITIDIDGNYFGVIKALGQGIYEVKRDVSIFIKNDGFDSVNRFLRWFNKDFDGKIIHWRSIKYIASPYSQFNTPNS